MKNYFNPALHSHTHNRKHSVTIKFTLLLLLLFLHVFLLTAQNNCYPEIEYQEDEPPTVPTCGEFTMTKTINNQNATDAFPNVDLVEGEKIQVEGTFTLDKTMTFKNCWFFFNENAELVTSGTVSLIAELTRFTNCGDKTWKGITINQNGTVSLTEFCGINGAEKALNLRKGYKWQNSVLVWTYFSRNRYCIFGDQKATIIGFKECHTNTFDGSGTLPGQPNVKPQAGIKVTECVTTFGSIFDYAPSNDPSDEEVLHDAFANNFFNFKFGVDASGGLLRIQNCIFARMRPEPVDGVPTGCGISATNKCNLIISAKDDPSNNRVMGYTLFDQCAFAGIKAIGCRLDVNFARFKGRQYYGITSTLNNNAQYIKRCNFVFGYDEQIAGISLDRPGFVLSVGIMSCEIKNNTFSGSVKDGVACIEVRCPNPNAVPMTIADNVATMTATAGGYFYGIIVYGNQSNNIKLINNTVDITEGSTGEFGIFLANCEGVGHELTNNTSTGPATCNYHIEKSRNVKYCDNTSDGASNGFHFYGDDDNTNWSVNTIGTHVLGLLIQDIPASSGTLASNGKIGSQTRRGNMWEEDDNLYSGFAAQCDADPEESLFLVEKQNDNSIFPQKTDPADGWFEYQRGPLNYCGSVGGFVSDFERRFAAGQVDTTNYTAAEQWEVKRTLLRTLLDNPSETNGSLVLYSYLSQNQNSTAGKFAKAERLMADPDFANPTEIAQLEAYYTDYDDLQADIDYLSQPANWDAVQIAAKFDTLVDLIEDIVTALDNLEQSQQSHLSQVLDSIDAISVAQLYEQAWKSLKKYELKIALGLSPAAAGYSDLETIANAAQSTYGAAVRHAWFHMPDCDKYNLIMPDESAEEREQGSGIHTYKPLGEDWIQIQPNPANYEITLTSSVASAGIWNIVSTSGQTIKTGNWTGTEVYVAVHDLAAGIYYATLIPDNAKTIVTKFVITH